MKVTTFGKVVIVARGYNDVGNLIVRPCFSFGIKFDEQLSSISHVNPLPSCVPFLFPLKI